MVPDITGERGRPVLAKAGIGLERMLRIYFLQQWFDLSDPAAEEALYDSVAMRSFVGIDLGCEPVPDETTMCKFRHLLEQHEMQVVYAESGEDGIEYLKKSGDVDVVLMDIMMPGMDGYQAMQAIRDLPGLEDLPIIAVTAKAMKGDREKCLEAGATDYLTKPVNVEQLLSLLRVWVKP